jgi:1-deoxy-D-xylulose-5-phosphate reductoisomerase
MVEFIDGSTIAQASPPSMKGPIGYALNQGERLDSVMNPIDWSKSHTWNFSPIDNVKFPAVELALRAGRLGTAATAMYNAANEEAVAAFLAGRISFTEIVDTVEKVVIKGEKNNFTPIRDLADVTAIEQDARLMANELLSR